MSKFRSHPLPIAGTIIGGYKTKSTRIILYCILLFPICVALLTEWREWVLGWRWSILLISIMGCVILPVIAILQLRWLLLHRRLIIAADRVQVIERSGGMDIVAVQIPFSNVAEIEYFNNEKHSIEEMAIHIRSTYAPGTFAGQRDFQSRRFGNNAYVIEGGWSSGYEIDMHNLAWKIQCAWEEWRKGEGDVIGESEMASPE